MSKNNSRSDALILREKAVSLLKDKQFSPDLKTEKAEILRLIYELEVHQIELELQNEELQKAKAELQISVDNYTNLYDFAPTGYFTLNKGGEIIQLNFSGASLIGKERSKLKNSHFGFFVSDDSKLIFDHFLNLLFTFRKKEKCEVVLVHDQDEQIYVNITGTINESGEQCLINVVDITDYKMAQKQIAKQNKVLVQQNKEKEKKSVELIMINNDLALQIHEKELLEAKLIIAKDKAEENERLKTAFLANMSHEIRTPMNGVLGFVELMRTPDLSIENQQKYLKLIKQGGDRLLEIINDIIDISKIQSGISHVTLSPCNVNTQIEYVFSFFKPEVERKGMRIFYQISLHEKEAIILSDREKVYAVLTNLVKNAIKYTHEGTIEIGYQLKSDHVTGLTDSPAELTFYVKDTGIGIAKDKLKTIFDRFVQIENKHMKSIHGVGLGLAIANSYAQMLDGRLWVESQPGVGSTFFFSIPYRNVEKEAWEDSVETLDTDIAVNIKKLKILIAEDDELSATLTTFFVEKYSKEILYAENGFDAVDICLQNRDLDMILMDVNMPLMHGFEAIREIREFNKDVYIITQTAYAYEEDRKKAFEAGCDDYITKPLNRAMLIRLLNNHFRK
jgi:signal transduction histidine kinase/CheY-like chemotaxis protein